MHQPGRRRGVSDAAAARAASSRCCKHSRARHCTRSRTWRSCWRSGSQASTARSASRRISTHASRLEIGPRIRIRRWARCWTTPQARCCTRTSWSGWSRCSASTTRGPSASVARSMAVAAGGRDAHGARDPRSRCAATLDQRTEHRAAWTAAAARRLPASSRPRARHGPARVSAGVREGESRRRRASFFADVLNNGGSLQYGLGSAVEEARRFGVLVLPPCVNLSVDRFQVDEDRPSSRAQRVVAGSWGPYACRSRRFAGSVLRPPSTSWPCAPRSAGTRACSTSAARSIAAV